MAARRLRGRAPQVLRKHWTGLLVAVLSLVLAVSAVVAPGLKVADVRLQDGVIFAINQSAGLLGTVNTQIKDLSSASTIAEQTFSILQEGRTVIVKGGSSNQMQSYDPSTGQLGSAVSLPASGDIAINAGKMAVISRLNGSVWFGDTTAMLQRDFNKEKALLDLGENALVTVTTDGQLIGLSLVNSQIVRFVNGVKTSSPVPMQLDASVANVQLSAVGDKAVVLDRTKQLIWFEGADQALEMPLGSRAQLSKPVPPVTLQGQALGAVVGTPTGLVGVTRKALLSLSGTMTEGTVKAPVSARGCVYGVVGSQVATACPGAAPVLSDIPQLATNADLSLRVNGDNVILNDGLSGDIWLVTDGMRRISDWSKVTPSDAAAKQQDPGQETTKVNPDRTAVNRPPVARDDQVSARVGRSTVLPILDNDSDPDGDIITVVSAPEVGNGVTLQLVHGGAGLQAVVAADAPLGTRTFSYTISDGRPGGYSNPAQVTLTIEPADQASSNRPPVLFSKDTIIVASGQQTQIRELLRWRDPDGDDMVLTGAQLMQGEDEVTFTPDGTITYTDVGKTLGIKQIAVTVSDAGANGTSVSTGILVLDVRKGQEVTPVANGDFATAMVGEQIEVSPLDNDQGVNLALASVDQPTPAAAAFSVNYATKTFRFKANAPGSYYVGYTVTNGRTSFGLVRIDVVKKPQENQPPVTRRDVVLLIHGGSVTLDPLLNDEDPDGDVLAVQSFTTSGLNVVMRDRHLLTISERTATDTPTTITYFVSDGYHSAVPGTIVVIPSNPVGAVSPVAVDDEVKVRVGDAVTVSPLDNDYSPVGLDLSLDTQLYDNAGGAWVDGSKIRFVAPAVPGRVSVTYKVKDTLGRTASATVRFTVISPDIANQPPNPEQVTGRVLAGTTQRIEIPLQNIDPNGDSVRLVGLGSGPSLGRVVTVGATYLEYEAFPGMAGTDSFTYTVVDSYGAKATGDIRVGVVPASITNTEPTANQDIVLTRPGRTVYIQPLANDSDPDGDKIGLVDTNPISFPIPAQVVDTSAIEVTVPDQEGTWFGTYRIRDARGALATGNIVITAKADAPLLAPKAFDDLVDVREVFQRDSVDVPVLANDYDPDGSRSDLVLSVPAGDTSGAQAVQTSSGWQLRVPIGDRLRVIRYTITDADGLSASAFVTVPGKSDATPWLKDPNVELTVTAGEVLAIPVAQYVSGTQGRKVIVSSADKVTGAPGIGRRDSASELTYQPGENDSGPAAITFEVIEDVDPSVTDARTATLTIRIKVLPRAKTTTSSGGGQNSQVLNQPPYAPNPIDIKAGNGEAPTEQNLQAFIVDPEGDAVIVDGLTSQLPTGLSATLEGSNIFATSDIGTTKGTSGIVKVHVHDARGAQNDIPVTITSVQTTRPLTVAVQDDVPDANQGQPSVVAVTANDKSSLVDPTLTVVNAVVEQGAGSVTFNAQSVTVTPDAAFKGTMTVRYTVMDATGDRDRNVDGRIVLTVRGRPTVPGIPRLVAVGDGSLDVTFTGALESGGLPITGYRVTATPTHPGAAPVQDMCPTTSCTVTGLTNAVEYTLVVSAHNDLGDSDPSGQSAPMTPDVVPDRMGAPTVERQAGRSGGVLVISWAPANNRGSAITVYTVTMKTQGGQSRTAPASATSMVWDNLTNGVDYSFTVQATNAAGPSQESDIGTGHPSAVPSAPSVTAYDGGGAGGGTVRVDWHAPADNGDTITSYLLNISTNINGFTVDGPADVVVPADQASGSYTFLFTGITNGQTYYVAVRAVNLAGNSDVGRSGAVMPYGAFTPALAPTVVPGDQKVTVSMPATPAPSGTTITQWAINGWDNAGDSVTSVGTANPDGSFSKVVTLPVGNVWGRTWRFNVLPQVQSTATGDVKQGGASPTSSSVQPFGKPGTPSLAIIAQNGTQGANNIRLLMSATPGPNNGNDPSSITLSYTSPWQSGDVNTSGQFDLIVPMNSSGIVSLTANTGGLVSDPASISILRPVSVDTATSVLTVRYASERPLYCEAIVAGSTLKAGTATDISAPGSPYYDYQWSYAGLGQPSGTSVKLQCGANQSNPNTYTITTTTP